MADAWVPEYLGRGLLNFVYLSACCPGQCRPLSQNRSRRYLAPGLQKFDRRFRQVEETTRARGRDVQKMSVQEMDQIWDQTKKMLGDPI
jgi:hypothetical protein